MVTLHLRTPAGDNINPMLISFSKGRPPRVALSFLNEAIRFNMLIFFDYFITMIVSGKEKPMVIEGGI